MFLTKSLILAGLVALTTCANARASEWPSVGQLENSLHLTSGATLPKYAQVNGKIFSVTYVKGRELSQGAYDVILQLREVKQAH